MALISPRGGIIAQNDVPTPSASGSHLPSSAPPDRVAGEIPHLDIGEFSKYLAGGEVLVVDARPEIFHRFGHIADALALPREEFEAYFKQHESELESHRDGPVIVYCNDPQCKDAEIVADLLQRKGFKGIMVYSGGWEEWTRLKIPTARKAASS